MNWQHDMTAAVTRLGKKLASIRHNKPTQSRVAHTLKSTLLPISFYTWHRHFPKTTKELFFFRVYPLTYSSKASAIYNPNETSTISSILFWGSELLKLNCVKASRMLLFFWELYALYPLNILITLDIIVLPMTLHVIKNSGTQTHPW